MDKAIVNISGRVVLLLAVLFSLPVCGQSFRLSYTTFADSLGETPLVAEIEYDITDADRRLVAITSFSGSFSDLTLPSSVVYDSLEYKVTEIGDAAFTSWEEDSTEQNCYGSLTLPDGISIIGSYAFENADFNIRIPDGVLEIGQGAFAGCRKLMMEKLPESLEIIGADAFRKSGLANIIHIPISVLEIGSSAFAECEALQGFSVDSDNLLFSVVDGILYDGEGAHLIQYPGGKTDSCFVVPSTVTDVEDAGFAGNHFLQTISFSNEDTSLWREVFLDCKGLESVTLPDNLENISDGLFSGCSRLKDIAIPDQVTSFGQQAFLDCSSLTSMTIPKDVMFLGKRCFWGCDGLQWLKAFPYEPPMMEREVFSKDSITVYSHYSSLDSYRQADQWSQLMTYIPIAEVYAENMSVYPLGNKQFDLVLETAGLDDALFDTVEFTLSLPEGFSLVSDTISGIVWTLPEEQPNGNLNVEVTEVQDGGYHFVVHAEDGKHITTGHYPLLTLGLCADSLFEDVDLSAQVAEAKVQSADLLVADMPSSFFTIQVEKLLLGDVNYDSRQNVVDVMSIVSYILDNQVPIPFAVADVNQDSAVDIVDVMMLVQIILWLD